MTTVNLRTNDIDVIAEMAPVFILRAADARLRRLISSRHFVLRIVGVSRIYVKLLSLHSD
jgi:hypothetical protein